MTMAPEWKGIQVGRKVRVLADFNAGNESRPITIPAGAEFPVRRIDYFGKVDEPRAVYIEVEPVGFEYFFSRMDPLLFHPEEVEPIEDNR